MTKAKKSTALLYVAMGQRTAEKLNNYFSERGIEKLVYNIRGFCRKSSIIVDHGVVYLLFKSK